MKIFNVVIISSAVLVSACENQSSSAEQAEAKSGLLAKPSTASVKEVAALKKYSKKLTPSKEAYVPVGRSGLVGIASKAGWAGAKAGEMYEGSGYKDPQQIQHISDEDMLAAASRAGDKSDDRQHALVSIGRRRVPGAVEAFEQALDPSEPLAIREMGLTGIMEHGGARGLDLLIKTLLNDESSHLRGLAIWGAAMWGPDAAEEAIEIGLKDDSLEVQGFAILAVWALKDQPELAFPIIIKAAESDELLIYQEGLNVLMRMPYPEAAVVLERIARNSEGDKQLMAVGSYRDWRRNYPDL